MPIIEGVSPDVPLIVPPILPGFYCAAITEIGIEKAKREGDQNMVMELKIIGNFEGQEVPDQNRTLMSWTSTKQKTNLRRIALSAGLEPQGNLDTDELKGKVVKIHVINEPYVDDKTKEQKVSARIKDFILPDKYEQEAKAALAARSAAIS